MAPQLLYTICVLGAVGLYLMLRPGRRAVRGVGMLLGLAVLGWLVGRAPFVAAGTPEQFPEPFFFIFSVIAAAAGVRMITHDRPVYSALYFILVVISSAGLFLLLLAEFMAFALVIVYAGAILITYVFVLMLAQQAEQEHAQPEYDLVPREPAAAALVGFVMLALFASMLFDPARVLPPTQSVADVAAARWRSLEQMPRRLEEQVRAVEPEFNWPPDVDAEGRWVRVDETVATVVGTAGDPPAPVTIELDDAAMPENVQLVGLALVARFPVSLELAGVILLLAMFGAVVLARKQIEIGEDEVREAAGLPRYDFHEDEPALEPPAGDRGGAS
jgi:NADH-quinone oxidoreductase subunit J